jgi:hypothetical protein
MAPKKLIIGPKFLDNFDAKFIPAIVDIKAHAPIEIIKGRMGFLDTPRPIPTPNASKLVANDTMIIFVKL